MAVQWLFSGGTGNGCNKALERLMLFVKLPGYLTGHGWVKKTHSLFPLFNFSFLGFFYLGMGVRDGRGSEMNFSCYLLVRALHFLPKGSQFHPGQTERM